MESASASFKKIPAKSSRWTLLTHVSSSSLFMQKFRMGGEKRLKTKLTGMLSRPPAVAVLIFICKITAFHSKGNTIRCLAQPQVQGPVNSTAGPSLLELWKRQQLPCAHQKHATMGKTLQVTSPALFTVPSKRLLVLRWIIELFGNFGWFIFLIQSRTPCQYEIQAV